MKKTVKQEKIAASLSSSTKYYFSEPLVGINSLILNKITEVSLIQYKK